MMIMVATGSIWDHMIEFIFPLILGIAYCAVQGRKKKLNSSNVRKVSLIGRKEQSPSQESISSSHREPAMFQSSIEQRHIESAITTRKLPSAISETKAPASSTLLEHADSDAYVSKVKTASRAQRLLANRSQLRNAFLLKEIFDRPYKN